MEEEDVVIFQSCPQISWKKAQSTYISLCCVDPEKLLLRDNRGKRDDPRQNTPGFVDRFHTMMLDTYISSFMLIVGS